MFARVCAVCAGPVEKILGPFACPWKFVRWRSAAQDSCSTSCVMRPQSCLPRQRSIADACRTGSCRRSASTSASSAAVNREFGRAHGTLTCVVLPHAPHATSACSPASNWKKSKRRHERRSRSRTRCTVDPQRGQASNAPSHFTLKSIRRLTVSSATSTTTHGGYRPNALVNSFSTPSLTAALLVVCAPRGYVDRLRAACPPRSR